MQTINTHGISSTELHGKTSVIHIARSQFESLLNSDLDRVFFNSSEFARPVSYTHITGETRVYNAIFDEPFSDVSPGSELSVNITTPQLKIKQDAFVRYPMKGDSLTFKGVIFVVDAIRPDGVGVMLLYLHRKGR